VSGTGLRSDLGTTCDGSCGDHTRMSVVWTTYECIWLDHLRMPVLGNKLYQLWEPRMMVVVGTTYDVICGDHTRISVMWTTCDGIWVDHLRMSVLGNRLY
jgi:hypothetical protein